MDVDPVALSGIKIKQGDDKNNEKETLMDTRDTDEVESEDVNESDFQIENETNRVEEDGSKDDSEIQNPSSCEISNDRTQNEIPDDNDDWKNFNPLYSRDELIGYFEQLKLKKCPYKDKIVIGMVGFPNVGKSSTINALLGNKKTSVSSTPGKTKHFQVNCSYF